MLNSLCSLWTKYTVAGKPSWFHHLKLKLTSVSSYSHPWIFRIHYALPAIIRRRCSRHWFFPGVPQHSPKTVDRCSVLFHAPLGANFLSQPRYCLEIVRIRSPYITLKEVLTIDLQLQADVHAGIVPYRSRNPKVQYTRLPSATRAVSLCSHLSIQFCSLTIFAFRFQKAIKKVRAVQRMRRNRGFAFSQTENPARQDQSRLIRAYDTSQTHTRPSGY